MTLLTGWPPRPWVPPEEHDELGLVGVGGDLSVSFLLRAYSSGIFPWFNEGEPVAWWSPNPRAIFELDGLHISRRLLRTIRSGKFEVSFNRSFTRVMVGCGQREEGTWITSSMLEAYRRLHHLGHAHSVEVWQDGELAGGVYGVAIGALFAAESMFFRKRDGSKVALNALVERLKEKGYELLDIQMLTEHTASLGAVTISRDEYLRRLHQAIQKPDVTFV